MAAVRNYSRISVKLSADVKGAINSAVAHALAGKLAKAEDKILEKVVHRLEHSHENPEPRHLEAKNSADVETPTVLFSHYRSMFNPLGGP